MQPLNQKPGHSLQHNVQWVKLSFAVHINNQVRGKNNEKVVKQGAPYLLLAQMIFVHFRISHFPRSSILQEKKTKFLCGNALMTYGLFMRYRSPVRIYSK